MTETGYDSAGPFGTTEAIQAARLPRVVMLCLANGVERVFVYRESGSTPSMHACSGVLRDDFSREPVVVHLRHADPAVPRRPRRCAAVAASGPERLADGLGRWRQAAVDRLDG